MKICYTGLGYEYVRCRAAGSDDTVYIHQLVALLDEDPAEVFSPDVDVHHCNHLPWDNRPANLRLKDARDHRVGHLDGRMEV